MVSFVLLSLMKNIKVLYIAGFERSGSTVVNRTFGQIDRFVAWGELRDIWQHAILENRLCSCGTPFHNCETWKKILHQGFGGINQIDALQLNSSLQKTRRYIAFKKTLSIPKKIPLDVQFYFANLSKLYAAIQAVTNCRVIVDSTKASWYGAALKYLPNLEVYTLHLTRDPRGVCHSLHRRKMEGEPECAWYNPVHASISWSLKNSAVESFLGSPQDRYLRMKFEDFVSHPQRSLEAVLKMLDENDVDLSFVQDKSVQMKIDHIFTGSPSSRSKSGNVKLRIDERWKRDMSEFDKTIITYLASGLMRKYEYVGAQS